ncbi:MAG TPA: magnesium chelatase [Clostridia bacterium]|nr:magnesium chelatase [Clostridia bacterium]
MKYNNDIVVHDGNRNLVECLKISALSTYIGVPVHLHATGLRGIGKTTVIRAFKNVLPYIERIKGCNFNCSPEHPVCNVHRGMSREGIEAVGREYIPMPFLEISHSAKPGTVAGGIDLKKLIDKDNPEAALLLGTIPRANRGIIFIDEINRLAETSAQITDILLDVMGTKPGRIQIEETGLSDIELPVSISVWAASNPDEEPGHIKDIRKQLSDRFDFEINVRRPEAIEEIKEVICGPDRLYLDELGEKLTAFSKERAKEPEVPDDIYILLANLYKNFSMESIRPVKSILQGAKILTMLENRKCVTREDVVRIISYMSNVESDYKEKAVQYIKTDVDGINSKQSGQDLLREGFISRLAGMSKRNMKARNSKINVALDDAKPLAEIDEDNWVVAGKDIKRIDTQ